MGFIIAFEVDEKFLDVKSHSLMLVNWHTVTFYPTFSLISTTERLFNKPQTTVDENKLL